MKTDQPVDQRVVPWAVVLDLEHPNSICRGLTAPPNEGRVSCQFHQRDPAVDAPRLVVWQRHLRGGEDVRGGGFRGGVPASARAVGQVGHGRDDELHPARGFARCIGGDAGKVSRILYGSYVDFQASVGKN